MNNKLSSIIILSMVLSILLATSLMAVAQTELTVWTRLEKSDLQPFTDEFEQQNPDIKIVIESIPGDQHIVKMTAAVQAGTPPDVSTLDMVATKKFAEMQSLEPLDSYIAKDNFDLSVFPDGPTQTGNYEGKQYGIPWGGDASAIVYNKDMFAKAGLDPDNPPRTWDEFTEAAKKLTMDTNNDGRTDVYGFAYVPAHPWVTTYFWLPYLWSNGGDFFKEDKDEVDLNSKEAVEALEFLVDLYRKYDTVPSSAIGPDTDDLRLFKMKRVAMIFGGPGQVKSIAEDTPDIGLGVMQHPSPSVDKPRTSFCGGDNIVIMKDSPNKEAAWEFVKYMVSVQGQENWFKSEEFLPVRNELLTNAYYDTHPNMKILLKAFLNSHLPPITAHYAEIQTYLRDAFMKASIGQMTPKEALDEAARKSNELIAKTGTR